MFDEEFSFIEIKNPKDISFLKIINYLYDFNDIKDKTPKQIKQMSKKII